MSKLDFVLAVTSTSLIKPRFFRVAFFPLQMGDHVFVGERSVVNAAMVGSYVYIGNNVVIVRKSLLTIGFNFLTIITCIIKNFLSQGRRCVLKDCCFIEDNTILPPETMVPSFTRYGGSPGVCVGDLPECTQELMNDFTVNYYQHFLPAKI